MGDQRLLVEKPRRSRESKGKSRDNTANRKLDEALLEAIDGTLKQIFKEPGARVIYDFLQRNPYLKLEEVAQKPELFSEGLKQLLGSAAPVIEELILKNLCSQLDWDYEDRVGHGFSYCVRDLREKYH